MTPPTDRRPTVVPIPVYDTSAEHLALAGALASADDFAHVRDRLTPDDFTSEPARLTYLAMLAVHQHGIQPTKLTLLDQLERMGHSGALGYLATLDGTAVAGSAPYYVNKIRVATRSRRLLVAAQRIQQLAALHPTDEVEAEERDAEVLDLTLALAQDIEQGDRVLPDAEQLRHAHTVRAEANKIRARADAQRLVIREQRGVVAMPDLLTGTQFLAQADDPVSYRIDQLWPTGGRVLLAAQYKAGKTTMMGNLLRSLVDADPFLGHTVTRQSRRTILLDNELSENMLRTWTRHQHIRRTDAFIPLSLKGRLTSFDILDPITRREWAEHLAAAQPDVLILDCLRPILDAFGLDENKDAGRFLTAFDELLGLAGIPEAVVVHHMGHQNERSRGDSRLRDWPDVEWRLARETDDPASPRYFTAFGRDVDIPEIALSYDATTRRLTHGIGSRKDVAVRAALDAVLEVLDNDTTGGLSGRMIDKALAESDHRQKVIRAAISLGLNTGQILGIPGGRGGGTNYVPNPNYRESEK